MTDPIETLRQYNAWRRGGDLHPMSCPIKFGEAIDQTIAEVERLRDAVDRCYRMLLTEPDTQGALFKAENLLREARGAA